MSTKRITYQVEKRIIMAIEAKESQNQIQFDNYKKAPSQLGPYTTHIWNDDLRKVMTTNTKMIIINSPQNPTGAVMNEAEIKEIYDIAESFDIYLLSDEVYGRMVYQDENTQFYSPSVYDQCKERTLLVHSFSKSYAMTG